MINEVSHYKENFQINGPKNTLLICHYCYAYLNNDITKLEGEYIVRYNTIY